MAVGSELKIILPCDAGAELVLDVGENGWTTVVLTRGQQVKLLGAEMFNGLASKLDRFLNDSPSSFQWVFSLSEPHSAAYGVSDPTGFKLRFQDKDGLFFDDVSVTLESVSVWKKRLQTQTLLAEP